MLCMDRIMIYESVPSEESKRLQESMILRKKITPSEMPGRLELFSSLLHSSKLSTITSGQICSKPKERNKRNLSLDYSKAIGNRQIKTD